MQKLFAWMPSFPLLLLLNFSGCSVAFLTSGHVKSVAITPASATIAVGAQQAFTANVTFADTTILTANANVFWSVSDSSVATISSDGIAKGIKAGSVTITGTFINVSGTASLAVTAAGVEQPQISGSAGKLTLTFPGNSHQMIYAANPLEDTISVSRTDLLTGSEAALGSVSVAPASRPFWLAIDPAGNFLYLANHGSSDISAFSIDPGSGRLTPVAGSPFPVDAAPWSIAVDPGGQFLVATHFNSSDVSRFRLDPLSGTLSPER